MHRNNPTFYFSAVAVGNCWKAVNVAETWLGWNFQKLPWMHLDVVFVAWLWPSCQRHRLCRQWHQVYTDAKLRQVNSTERDYECKLTVGCSESWVQIFSFTVTMSRITPSVVNKFCDPSTLAFATAPNVSVGSYRLTAHDRHWSPVDAPPAVSQSNT